jgi:hypothetical protein
VDRLTEKQDNLRDLPPTAFFPLSGLATRLFVVAAISGVLFFMGERALEKLLKPFDSWARLTESPLESVGATLILLAILAVAALVVGVVSSVAQMGSASFSVRLRLSKELNHKRLPLMVVLTTLVSGFLAVLAVRYTCGDLLEILHVQRSDLGPGLLKRLLTHMSKLVVVASSVLAILVVFGYRFGLLIKPQSRG